MNRIKVAVVGVGGSGRSHLEAVEQLEREGLAELIAFAETYPAQPVVKRLRGRGVPHYLDFQEMLVQEPDLELVCIAAPIPYHFGMSIAAFRRGVHVFVNKPPAVRIQELRAMIAMRDENDCLCVVDFRDVARPEVIALKNRLCEGVLGNVLAIHGEARRSGMMSYYNRHVWAGRTRLRDEYVLDGPMNNSCAQVLNLASFLAGDEPHDFALPVWVQGEIYCANDIEGEDTDCLRAMMDTGAEVCLHLTQCAASEHPDGWTVIGEKGVARLHQTDGVTLPEEHIPIDTAGEHPTTSLLRRQLEVLRGSDEPLLMPLDATEGFVLLSNGAYESSACIHPIPREFRFRQRREEGIFTVIPEIDNVLLTANATGRLLGECGVPWSARTYPFSLEDYNTFPQQWIG